MPSPYHHEHDAYLRNYLQTNQARVIGTGREVEGLRKDGSIFPLELAISELNFAGEKIFTGIVRDVTERKSIEQAMLTAKQAAERANRQKSAFLNVMSHELRTPLTVILGYLPILKNQQLLPSSDTITQIAEDMDISGNHLLELINDLLDISKIEAGEMTLHPEKVATRPLLHEMLRRFENQAKLKHLRLLVECEDFSFMADARRLRQILINLIGNAIKFTAQGEIKITAKAEDTQVVFVISDTGVGIPENDLPHIFKTFRQVDDSSTRTAGGSGLGLAITKRLVELHGGMIHAESLQGRGSRFTFSIKQQ
jgi:signal transduction histidine kinase